MWFGMSSGGVYRYDGLSFVHFLDPGNPKESGGNTIKSILEDKNGNLWFCSWSNAGVYRFQADRINHPCNNNTFNHNLQVAHDLEAHQAERALSFTHITMKDGLSDDMISCMLEDKNGNIWIGTRDQGACRFDGKTFTRFAEQDGLAPCVFCIAEDKNGNIWFGHDGQNGEDGHGVSRYDGKAFTGFTKKDGLTNNNVLSIVEDKSGNLWFGTRFGGLCRYDGKTFIDFTGQTAQ
jgi:ligand-binding sensor domain-containing protein